MIKLPPATFQVTPYGDVDAKARAFLRENYDTSRLLAAVELLDVLQPLFAVEGGLRDDLLRLHAMAHTVLNGAPLTVSPSKTDLWEAAQETVEDLSRIRDVMQEIASIVRPLEDLEPLDR